MGIDTGIETDIDTGIETDINTLTAGVSGIVAEMLEASKGGESGR